MEKLELNTITKLSGAKLISYSGHEIKAVGKATIAVECKDKYYLLDVQVVNSDVIPYKYNRITKQQ